MCVSLYARGIVGGNCGSGEVCSRRGSFMEVNVNGWRAGDTGVKRGTMAWLMYVCGQDS